MKTILLVSLLAMSTNVYSDELKLRMDKELSGNDYSDEVKISSDLPEPQLVFDKTISYTPTTRIRHRIINGGTNIAQFKALPESEYYKGN